MMTKLALRRAQRVIPPSGFYSSQSRFLFTKGAKNYVNNSNSNLLKAWLKILKKELYLLRGTMIKQRPMNVPNFLQGFLTSNRRTVYTLKKGKEGIPSHALFTMSYSEISGHTAFLFSLMMYLETELFNLRLFAIGSIASSILFQYYRETPLMIPIRWNMLFIAINLGMLSLLIREYNEAEHLPSEQKALYMKYFAAEGMDKIDFLHFMSRADKVLVAPGDIVLEQGKMNHYVYFIADGSVQVLRDQDVVTNLGSGSFVAEMGFVKWREHEVQRQREERERLEREKEQRQKQDMQSLSAEVERSLTYMGGSLATPSVHPDDRELHITSSKNLSSSRGNRTSEKREHNTRTWGQYLGLSKAPSSFPAKEGDESGYVFDPSLGFTIDVKNKGCIASADVVNQKKKSIIYRWRFGDLDEIMGSRKNVALVLERSFNNDLSKKMRKQDLKQKYKYLLMGLTLASKDSAESVEDLDPSLVGKLKELRREYGVSQKIHREVCDELQLPLSIFSAHEGEEAEINAAKAAALRRSHRKKHISHINGSGGVHAKENTPAPTFTANAKSKTPVALSDGRSSSEAVNVKLIDT